MTTLGIQETTLFLSLLLCFLSKHVSCIACFKCVSAGGDNPSCEDPFHNNMTEGEVTLEQPCMGGRKGRDGLFPASDCIKVTGYYADTGESMMIRGCAVDSGTLTTDTEIIRMSHCGAFYFDKRSINRNSIIHFKSKPLSVRYVKGCVQ